MAKLSTHVLNVVSGQAAEGIKIELFKEKGGELLRIKSVVTNVDGRTDEPLLNNDSMAVGQYALLFHVSDYFTSQGVAQSDPPFFSKVPVEFSIADAKENYHVPLLISPWSYSTYRGS